MDVNNPFTSMKQDLQELDDRFDVFLGKVRGDSVIVGPMNSLQNKGISGREKTKYDKVESGDSTNSISHDYDAEIIALKDKYAKRLITQEEYENKLDALELAHLEYRLKTENLKENKRVELKQKITDKKIAIMEKAKKKEQYIENVIDSSISRRIEREKGV